MDHPSTLEVKIVTVSDGVAVGDREDISGENLHQLLDVAGWLVIERKVVKDGKDSVARTLGELAENFHGLIVTTGGTGFGPRDQTPEGTREVIEREAPGLAEAMRLANPLGRLSRATAGTLGTSLILNVPGSAKGSVECLEAVIDIVDHAVRLLVDNSDPHPTKHEK